MWWLLFTVVVLAVVGGILWWYTKYSTNRDKDPCELDAINLNSQGDNFFDQGRYQEAHSKYQEAYDKSQITSEKNKYAICKDNAKTELDAVRLKELGDREFNAGRYDSARVKYQEAYDKSQITSEKNKYAICKNNAKTELDAVGLKELGDREFNAGRYDSAGVKYQEAYDKSQITSEKYRYASHKEKAETIIIKLSRLETLWNNAWEAENDAVHDRSEEAGEVFRTVLSEAESGLNIIPNEPKFKLYERLASLKIKGNKLFNQGLASQQDGLESLKEAERLKQQQKYELANEKFVEAKEKFSNAKQRFEEGSNEDPRFVSCVECVKEHLKEVMESIRNTGQHMLFSGLCDLPINISSSSYLENDSLEVNAAKEHNNYYAHI